MSTAALKESQNSHAPSCTAPAPARNLPAPAPATTTAPAASAEALATPAGAAPQPPAAASRWHRYRKWLLWGGILAGALVAGHHYLVPLVDTAMNTVSTDDAYVNGHVTLVAPRVSGQVVEVLVDDNMHVKKGQVLVRLDREPFQVKASLKRAAVQVAEANLKTAWSKARGLEALASSQRWKMETAVQQVKNQTSLLKARVATLRNKEATLDRALAEFERGQRLTPVRAMSREEFDQRYQQWRVAQADVNQARESIYQVRASLGLPPEPNEGKPLDDVPTDLPEKFSDVRSAFSDLVQTMTELGLPLASSKWTPTQAIARFHQRDKDGDLDRILRELLPRVPSVVQAQGQLEQARHDLEQAELDLRYCDVVSEIDGLVLSRNVNPGNNVQAGQQLMAVRSVTEIWIDANFKETQLADLRIGQRVKIEVDMYGSHREFEGRITGFTMGTGQTLALLPPQNATGNFVKIVQRLPVRIELTDYNPAEAPLFVGLSVTPYVYFKEPAMGPHAGEFLQPPAVLPKGPRSRAK
jgi:membrane fusion protein (multidrug efflux system)